MICVDIGVDIDKVNNEIINRDQSDNDIKYVDGYNDNHRNNYNLLKNRIQGIMN